MTNYVKTSLENHLFFGRIMKEHALFLMAGFPAIETSYINEANWYRDMLENGLLDPTEEELMETADHVLREANHYLRLLEE